jgi:hypothetical protein
MIWGRLCVVSLAGSLLVACSSDPGSPVPGPSEPTSLTSGAWDDENPVGLGWDAPSTSLYRSWCPGPPHDPLGTVPTPAAPLQGRGSRWTALLGRSLADFPGTAATIGIDPAGGHVLLAPDDGRPCVGSRPPDTLGDAVRLTLHRATTEAGFTCSDGSGEARPCGALVQQVVASGALTVIVRPSKEAREAIGPLRQHLARLACHLRVYAHTRGVLAHLAIEVPARAAIGPLADIGDLVFLEGAHQLRPEELRTGTRVIRSLGNRPVVAASVFDGRTEEAISFLVDGGVLSGVLAEETRRAVAFLRSRADLVDRPAATVGLLVEPGTTPLDSAARAVSHLEGLFIPFDVVPAGPASPHAGASLQERAERFGTVVTLDGGYSPAVREAIQALPKSVVVVRVEELSSDGAFRAGSASVPAATWSGTGSPVRIEPFIAPDRNSQGLHLIARRRVDGGSVLVPVWREGDFDSCRATWHEPLAARSSALPCRMRADRKGLEFALPPFDRWAVLEVGLGSPAPALVDPGDRVTVEPGNPSQWSELVLAPPAWPDGSVATLAFPEFFDATGAPDGVWDGLRPSYSRLSETVLGLVARTDRVEVTGALEELVDGVRMKMQIRNLSGEPLRDVSALICLSTWPSGQFPSSGHRRTFYPGRDGLISLDRLPIDDGDPLYVESRRFSHPLTVLESVERDLVLGHAFEASSIVGGNGGTGVCVHSRPEFGDIAPGEAVQRRGRLWLRTGVAGDILADYLAEPLEEQPRAWEASSSVRPSLPCVSQDDR